MVVTKIYQQTGSENIEVGAVTRGLSLFSNDPNNVTINSHNTSTTILTTGNILDKLYPVGSIYASSSSEDKDPTQFIGGTWVKLDLKDKIILEKKSAYSETLSADTTRLEGMKKTINFIPTKTPLSLISIELHNEDGKSFFPADILENSKIASGRIWVKNVDVIIGGIINADVEYYTYLDLEITLWMRTAQNV